MRTFFYIIFLNVTYLCYSQPYSKHSRYLIGDFEVTKIDSLKSYYLIEIMDDKNNISIVAVEIGNSKNGRKNRKENRKKIVVGQKYFFYLKNYLYLDYRSIDFDEPIIFDNTTVWTKDSTADIFFTPNLQGLFYRPFSIRE